MILSVQDVFLLRLLEHIVNDAILVILVRHPFGRRLDAVLVAAQVPSTSALKLRPSVPTSMSKEDEAFWSCRRLVSTISLKFLKG